jgi:hypothetical protein
MTAKHDALLQQVAQNDALVNRLQAELDTAKRQQWELHAQALKAVCPFAQQDREKRFIPLGPTRALLKPVLAMRPGHVPGQPPIWQATGQEVRFRLGRVENIRQTSLDQPAFEALPEDVKTLTFQDMVSASQAQKLVGMDKPLKLTERQLQMFANLAGAISERIPAFNPQGVEGGQPLPSGIWGSMTDTLEIWRAMAKRGVLEIVQGNEQSSFHQYRVNPGPRFEEAVDLFLTSDILPRDSVAYRKVMEAFRPGQEPPSSPPKRLRR